MSDDIKARSVPVELVEDSCGDGGDGSDPFANIDYDFFVDTLKACPTTTAKWFSMHFRVPESTIQKFCQHNWGENFATVKNFLRGYTEIFVAKKQLIEINNGNSSMMAFWGQAHMGQGRNTKPEEQEIKPIPLAYVPKSQRKKEE